MIESFWPKNEADLRARQGLNPGPMALTIGNFDGVHLGHQHIFTRMRLWCEQNKPLPGAQKTKMTVLTFSPHPVQVLFPERRHQQLFDQADQKEQLEKQGVNWVYLQSFTKDFAAMPKQIFLEKIVMELLHPQCLVVGYDFGFGTNREGGLDDLKSFFKNKDVFFEQVQALKIDGQIVSSSNIREQLAAGQVHLAKQMLGRNFYVRGQVIKGDQRGRTLGFPTANILPAWNFLPALGVYAGYAIFRNQRFLALANLGKNKTFNEDENAPVKVEVHILNFNQDLYAQELRFEFEHFLREEKRFSSVDDLKNQIQLDIENARGLLL